MRSPLLLVGLLAVLGGTPACGGADDDGISSDEGAIVTGGAVCATQHMGTTAEKDAVTICDKTFDDAPLVRPPADAIVKGGASTLYVGIRDLLSGGTFVDRAGKAYVLTSAGKVLSMKADKSPILTDLRMPSSRYMYLVYKIIGTIGEAKDPQGSGKVPSIEVTSAAPAIMLTGDAIDGAQIGAWEGSVPERTNSTNAFQRFDPKKRVPIRVSFTAVKAAPKLANFTEWSGSAMLRDGSNAYVAGVLENVSKNVKAADGSCIKSLAALGASDPFDTSTSADIGLYRVESMHFPGDAEHVIDFPKSKGGAPASGWSMTGMGSFGRFLPSDFIAKKAGSGTMSPHGMPSGADILLHPVKGGGGGC